MAKKRKTVPYYYINMDTGGLSAKSEKDKGSFLDQISRQSFEFYGDFFPKARVYLSKLINEYPIFADNIENIKGRDAFIEMLKTKNSFADFKKEIASKWGDRAGRERVQEALGLKLFFMHQKLGDLVERSGLLTAQKKKSLWSRVQDFFGSLFNTKAYQARMAKEQASAVYLEKVGPIVEVLEDKIKNFGEPKNNKSFNKSLNSAWYTMSNSIDKGPLTDHDKKKTKDSLKFILLSMQDVSLNQKSNFFENKINQGKAKVKQSKKKKYSVQNMLNMFKPKEKQKEKSDSKTSEPSGSPRRERFF